MNDTQFKKITEELFANGSGKRQFKILTQMGYGLAIVAGLLVIDSLWIGFLSPWVTSFLTGMIAMQIIATQVHMYCFNKHADAIIDIMENESAEDK